MTKTLNVYINNRPKNNTTPNNTKIDVQTQNFQKSLLGNESLP